MNMPFITFYYYLFTFWILLVYILHFVWSFNYVQCYNALLFWEGVPNSDPGPIPTRKLWLQGASRFGLIADFRIYARCLSDDEAAQLGLGMFSDFFGGAYGVTHDAWV